MGSPAPSGSETARRLPAFGYGEERIKVYRSDEDLPVIRSLGASLAQPGGQGASAALPASFAIEPLPRDDLFLALKRVPQYRDARFEIQDLALDAGLRVSQIHVKEYKLLQMSNLAAELTETGVELFAPCRYRLPNSSISIITPPVVEMTPQGPVMIEGHTRAFLMRQQGRNKVQAVVVHNVQAALPVSPRPLQELRIAHGTVDSSTNMPGFDRCLIRKIEELVHP